MSGFRFLQRIGFAAFVALPIQQGLAAVNITGIVADSAGVPIAGAAVKLEPNGATAMSGSDGKFTLGAGTALSERERRPGFATLHQGTLYLSLAEGSVVTVTAYGTAGRALASVERRLDAGTRTMELPRSGSGVGFYRVTSGSEEIVLNALSIDGVLRGSAIGYQGPAGGRALAKSAADAMYDVITVTKSGYLKGYLSVSVSEMANADIKLLKETSPKFSFFVTSMKALIALSTKDGFGGDFRYGETGPGAGLRGADKICAAIAERSMPSSSFKGWRAFLSATAGHDGKQVNAIDRIGQGPWYDRVGRVMAPTKADLLAVRPTNGDPTIRLDLPNENGIPNHRPDPNLPADDNHHTITGSDAAGKLKSATATCKDWTTSVGSAENGKPSAGFSWPRGGVVSNMGSNWMTTGEAPGCAAGMEIIENGPAPQGSIIIGGGGGYGGFYCFALQP
jgi:hypothetical protein